MEKQSSPLVLGLVLLTLIGVLYGGCAVLPGAEKSETKAAPAPVLPPLVPAPPLPPLATNPTPSRYCITALPAAFQAAAINNKGQIVGTWDADNTGLTTQAAVWAKGKLRKLRSLDEVPRSEGTCISDNGMVGGEAKDAYSGAVSVFVVTPLLWDTTAKNPVPRPLTNASAYLSAVNSRRQAVGYSTSTSAMDEGDMQFAFFWDGKQEIILGNAATCRANGLNERGQVVGSESGKIILWQEKEKRVLCEGAGRAINNRGQVVGSFDFGRKAKVTIPAGVVAGEHGYMIFESTGATKTQTIFYPITHALFHEKGKSHDLGVLPRQYFSWAAAINDRGQIVGVCSRQNRYQFDFDVNQNRAFLWQAERMTDLNRLLPKNSGWNIFDARGINNAGQIIGTGTFGGKKRDFLLTPR